MRITRGLGDRQRTLERTRTRDGNEQSSEELKGIASPDDAEAFDAEWQRTAASQLPPGRMVAPRARPRRGLQTPELGGSDSYSGGRSI